MAIANVTEASLSHILHANLFKFIWQSVKPGHPTQTLTSTKGNKNTLMDDASTYPYLPWMRVVNIIANSCLRFQKQMGIMKQGCMF